MCSPANAFYLYWVRFESVNFEITKTLAKIFDFRCESEEAPRIFVINDYRNLEAVVKRIRFVARIQFT